VDILRLIHHDQDHSEYKGEQGIAANRVVRLCQLFKVHPSRRQDLNVRPINTARFASNVTPPAMTRASKTLFTLLVTSNLAWSAYSIHSQRTLWELTKRSSGLESAVEEMRSAFHASRRPGATRERIIYEVQGTNLAEPAVERDGYWWWGSVGMSFSASGQLTDILVRSDLADQHPLPVKAPP
jgi:hypothetical protein